VPIEERFLASLGITAYFCGANGKIIFLGGQDDFHFSAWQYRFVRRLLNFAPGMQSHNPACPSVEFYAGKSGMFKPRLKLLGRRKLANRPRQVGIRRSISRNPSAQERQNVPEIETVERAKHLPARFRKFQNRYCATRFQHTQNFQ